MEQVHVHVDYCAPCGLKAQFDEMTSVIKERVPNAQITGKDDLRSGAFEVAINGKTVHSRLQNLALPDYNDVADVVKKASEGGSLPDKLKQQPITDCVIS